MHDIYGSRHEHERKEAYGQKVGEVTLTRPDTGAVQRQVAYHDEKSGTWTVDPDELRRLHPELWEKAKS